MKIIILPGLDGTGTLVGDLANQLSQQHHVTAIRYPADLYQYDALRNWITQILPNDDFILVTESFSGPLAIMIAHTAPKGLKGVVFVATFARSPRKFPALLTYILAIMPLKSRLLTRGAQFFVMGKWSNHTFTTAFRRALDPIALPIFAKRLREVRKVDVTENLKKLTLPMVYLCAKNDRLVPKAMADDFRQPTCRIITVDGPHFLLQANYQDTAQIITKFATQFRPDDVHTSSLASGNRSVGRTG